MNTKYIIIGIMIVVCILLICYFISNGDSARRNRARASYRASNGEFDQRARQALTELTRIAEPIAEDYFLRGNIIEYNVLQGNPRPVVRNGGAEVDQLDEIVGAMIDNYMNALQIMAPEPQNIFMLDHIDGVLIAIGAPGGENITPALHENIVEARQETARQETANKVEAVEKFFNDSTIYTSNPQNVHDTRINIDLRATLAKFKKTYNGTGAEIFDCRNYIATVFTRDPHNYERANNALRILDVIVKGSYISTFDETEDRIFTYVWNRCDHPNNASNKENMREAVVIALSDAVENDIPVCINGRCSQVLNSLTTLDFDPEIASRGALTTEAYKNEIYQETTSIIKDHVAAAKNSPIEALAAVGRSFTDRGVEVDPEVEAEFIGRVKKDIDENLAKYVDKFSVIEIERLRSECYAGIDV